MQQGPPENFESLLDDLVCGPGVGYSIASPGLPDFATPDGMLDSGLNPVVGLDLSGGADAFMQHMGDPMTAPSGFRGGAPSPGPVPWASTISALRGAGESASLGSVAGPLGRSGMEAVGTNAQPSPRESCALSSRYAGLTPLPPHPAPLQAAPILHPPPGLMQTSRPGEMVPPYYASSMHGASLAPSGCGAVRASPALPGSGSGPSSSPPAWGRAPCEPLPPPDCAPGSSSSIPPPPPLDAAQQEFANLLQAAGMRGLGDADVRQLYAASQTYAMQAAEAASRGETAVFSLPGQATPMVPVGGMDEPWSDGAAVGVQGGAQEARRSSRRQPLSQLVVPPGDGSLSSVAVEASLAFQVPPPSQASQGVQARGRGRAAREAVPLPRPAAVEAKLEETGEADGGSRSPRADSRSPRAGSRSPQAPRRRGRRPADTSQLTAKQVRAREAQKRFREKQKSRMVDTEQEVELLCAELERAQVSQAANAARQRVLEKLLRYKDSQLATLEAAAGEAPAPGLAVRRDMAEIMRSRTVPGMYDPELLLRYHPPGFTEHLDEQGRVREAPPLDKIFEDWTEIVGGLRAILLETLVDGEGAEGEEEEKGLGEGEGKGDGKGEVAEECSTKGAAEVAQEPRPTRRSGRLRRGAGAAAGDAIDAAGGAVDAAGGAIDASAGSLSASSSPLAAPTAPDLAESSALVVAYDTSRLWDHVARSLMASVGPGAMESGSSEEDPASSSVLLDRGVVIRHGAASYAFHPAQLQRCASLLRRMGLLTWQQALLFPDNVVRMTAVRADTGTPDDEAASLPRWRGVLRALCLRPEQLRAVVSAHAEFLAVERPLLARRAELMRALRDPRWADGPGDGSAQATYVPLLSQAVEATQELARGVEAETAANAALSGAIVRIMDFPVQKSMLLALSYPFFVNANLVAACAALELGVSMEDLELPVGLEFLRDAEMEEADDG